MNDNLLLAIAGACVLLAGFLEWFWGAPYGF